LCRISRQELQLTLQNWNGDDRGRDGGEVMALSIDKVLKAYAAMRKAHDDYVGGWIDGDALAETIVDYTDAIGGSTITYNKMGSIARVRKEDE
jgi:hypothetical protein